MMKNKNEKSNENEINWNLGWLLIWWLRATHVPLEVEMIWNN